MSFLYRHESSIERQVFLLARVWQVKGLVDSPTLSQVSRFVSRAVDEGEWVPSTGGAIDTKIVDLLHTSLQERAYIDSVGLMGQLDRDGNSVERQAFLLACVWDDRSLADGPTLSQVERFMEQAENEGQWTPEEERTDNASDAFHDIAILLFENLQFKRPRSQQHSSSCCKAVDYIEGEGNEVRCVHPIIGEKCAPLGVHFCVHHISCWFKNGIVTAPH
jgi:hypothetical protein